MSAQQDAKPQWFDAFVKAAQYIVRLKSQQDVWDHLAKLIVTSFPAVWVAFARRDGAAGIGLHHSTLPGDLTAEQILRKDVRNVIGEVLDSGFLASHVVAVPTPSMTALLPIVVEYQAKEVMLVGHQDAEPLSKELLDVYLAIAGLAGTAFERLHSEQELNRHRAHLEELVKGRTAELARAKRHNELILSAVREGICGVDLEGRITFVNPFAAKLIGWKPAELIGRSAHDTFHHTRPDGCGYPVEECVLHTTLTHGEMREASNEEFFRKDGTRFPVEFRTAPIVEEGKPVGAVIVFQDITERKRAEREREVAEDSLREAHAELETRVGQRTAELNQAMQTVEAEQQRFQEVLDQLPAYVVLLTPDYHVAFANSFFEERFGKSEGRRCYEYLFHRTEPCENCETYRVLGTGEPQRWEWTGPDGANYDIYDFPFTDVDGSPLIMEVGLDITVRKQAEESLRLANAYNRSLIEASLDPLVTIGPDGKITDVNSATEAATDRSRAELIGTDFCDYFTEPEKAHAGYEQVFRERAVRDYALDLRHRDGHVSSVLYNASVYRDEEGKVVGVFAAARDITERKRAEAAIKEVNERLEQRVAERTAALTESEQRIRASLAEKEVLLKEIHHRVKNNMQVISSLVALQADRLQDASMREVLQDVTHRVRSMALVHEKLYQSPDMARVEFAEYAQSLLNYLWRAHGTAASGVRLVTDLEPMPLSVNAAVPCGLILNELVSNALKHAFRGRASGEVAVSLRGSAEGQVCLRVRDNGTGLPAGLDWRQADTLGLHLVQILAGQLRATVEFSSGEGTEFTITFQGPKA